MRTNLKRQDIELQKEEDETIEVACAWAFFRSFKRKLSLDSPTELTGVFHGEVFLGTLDRNKCALPIKVRNVSDVIAGRREEKSV